MRQRILGLLEGRRRRSLIGVTAVAAAAGTFLIANALAVHDLGLFELDRNAQDDVTVR